MVLAIIQSVVLVPLYIANFGSEHYGWWLALSSLVAFAALADFGITGLVIQRTAVLIAKGSLTDLARFFGSLLFIVLIIALIIILVAIPASMILPKVIGVDSAFIAAFRLALILAFIDLVMTFITSILGSILFGAQKPTAHMIGMLAGTAASILVTLVLLKLNFGILAIPLGSLVRPLISIPINAFSLIRHFKYVIASREIRMEKEVAMGLLSSSLWLGPAKMCETVISQADSIIVMRFMSGHDVSAMSITRKTTDLVIQVVGRISASILSGLSQLIGTNDFITAQKTVGDLFLATASGACLLLSPVMLLNKEFVTLWTNTDLYSGQIVTSLFLIYAFLKIFRLTCSNVIFACGELRTSAISSYCEAGVQALLGILLCPHMGISGIAIACVISSLVGLIILVPRLVRIFKVDYYAMCEVLVGLALTTSFSLTIGWEIKTNISGVTWTSLFMISAVMSIIWVVTLFLIERRFRVLVVNVCRIRPISNA